MGLLGSIFGGSGAYKKNKRDLENAKNEARSMYSSVMNESPLATAAAQAALNKAQENFRDKYSETKAQAAMTGGTDASVAMQKAANNNALAGAMSSIAAQSTARKDGAMSGYLSATKNYTDAIAQQRTAQAQAESAALSGLIGAGASLASGTMAANALSKKNI